MRRKNRQIKLMVDIPPEYKDEEEFMFALADRLDETGWNLKVDDNDMPITEARLNDFVIEPEEE